MAIPTDPNVLAALSTCYRCIPEGDRGQVLIYILADAAGLSGITASELMALSKCYCGIPEGDQAGIFDYLMTQIANGGGGPPAECENVEGDGDPGALTPEFETQTYTDTSTGNVWRATGTGSGDWELQLQNMQVLWEPTGVEIPEKIGFYNFNNVAGVTSLTFEQTTTTEGFDIELMDDLVSISFPNLVTVALGGMNLLGHPLLTSISIPLLEGNSLAVIDCVSLASLSLPSFETSDPTLQIRGCASLTTLSLPVYVPTNGVSQNLSGNALNAASVNAFLARCVSNVAYASGTVDITGGTNAAPSGQGILDKATLIGRGCTVNTN